MRMLGKSGTRRVFIRVKHGDSRRCKCSECVIDTDKQTQRTREKREWKALFWGGKSGDTDG